LPSARSFSFITPGAVAEEAVVEDGKIVVGKVMRISATFDHRFIDGFHAGMLAKTMREAMEKPFEFFDPLPSNEVA
jgi:pyruvate dehydrogenase E2 component (dihydrolipoamide acetyltransferase)